MEKINFIIKALSLSEKARREGLLALEDETNEHVEEVNNRDIFWYGLRFVIDGTDSKDVKKILKPLINSELDEIKKEAVLSIQKGNNPRMTLHILGSLLNKKEWQDLRANFLHLLD